MEEKKLTDEEIVKALKNCKKDNCIDCPYLIDEHNCNANTLLSNILDLIHRLQSENETLKSKKFANWKLKFFKAQEELEKLKKDCVFLEMDRNQLRFELNKELSEHEEFTKKANATIELLTTVLGSSKRKTKILDLQREIELLTEEHNEEYELRKEYMFACEKKDLELKQLKFENVKLQKQVDELERKVESYQHSFEYIQGYEDGKQQAVKDTAKEIYQELCEHGTTYVKKWIKERYGVEVE